MKAEFVNPFLEAAALVFKQMLGVDMIRGKTAIKTTPAPSHDIAILINITGKVNGQVIYSLNFDAVQKIVRKLMPGISDAGINTEFKDVLGELSNMITGNALNIFLKNDQDLDVTVPVVVDTRITKAEFKNQTTLGLNMYSDYGLLEVNICMN